MQALTPGQGEASRTRQGGGGRAPSPGEYQLEDDRLSSGRLRVRDQHGFPRRICSLGLGVRVLPRDAPPAIGGALSLPVPLAQLRPACKRTSPSSAVKAETNENAMKTAWLSI